MRAFSNLLLALAFSSSAVQADTVKTLPQVRDELAAIQNAILKAISTRVPLGEYDGEEQKIVYSVLAAERPSSNPPPDDIFYGDEGKVAPPYIFYSSDKVDDFGKPKKKGGGEGVPDNIFDFVKSQLEALEPSSPSTAHSRGKETASLLTLASKRAALGVDVAKAKLAASPALRRAISPIDIRQLLTNHTQEEVVRASLRKESEAMGVKEFDIVGLFNILIDVTTDVEVATVLDARPYDEE